MGFESVELQSVSNEQKQKNYIERGMPSKFKTLKQFCAYYRIDYEFFRNLYCTYPGKSFQELCKQYYFSNQIVNYVHGYSYYGISLSAICLKFQLNYSYCIHQLDLGKSFEETFLLGVLHSLLIPDSISILLEKVLPMILSTSYDDMDSLIDLFGFNRSILPYLRFCKKRITELEAALPVYRIVYFLEYEWEENCSEKLESLQRNSYNLNDYWNKYNQLKRSEKQENMKSLQLSNKDLNDYYRNYYSDYLLFSDGEQKVWQFNRKRSLGFHSKKNRG